MLFKVHCVTPLSHRQNKFLDKLAICSTRKNRYADDSQTLVSLSRATETVYDV